jgi:GTP-binding protein
VHLLEPLPADGSDPVKNYHLLRRELELYRQELAGKPEIVAVSKLDLSGAEEVRQRVERELGCDVLGISAATGAGLARLVGRILELLDAAKPQAALESTT